MKSFFFFRMAYLNAWLMSFVGYTHCYNVAFYRVNHEGSTSYTRFRNGLTGWPRSGFLPALLREVIRSGFFHVHRVWLSYTRDWRHYSNGVLESKYFLKLWLKHCNTGELKPLDFRETVKRSNTFCKQTLQLS